MRATAERRGLVLIKFEKGRRSWDVMTGMIESSLSSSEISVLQNSFERIWATTIPVHGRLVRTKLLRPTQRPSNSITSRDQGIIPSTSSLPPPRQVGHVQGPPNPNGCRHRTAQGRIRHPVFPRIPDEIRFRTLFSSRSLVVTEPTGPYRLA